MVFALLFLPFDLPRQCRSEARWAHLSWSKSEWRTKNTSGVFPSYSSPSKRTSTDITHSFLSRWPQLITKPLCACLPGGPDWRQIKKTPIKTHLLQTTNHSLKITSRGSHACRKLPSEDRNAEGAVADKTKETFIHQPSKKQGREEGWCRELKQTFFMDTISTEISFGQTAVFPPQLVCHRRYHVSQDLMRSEYLWDSWGAAKVNMATISISSLHSVCRLKAVRHIASRAAKQVSKSTDRCCSIKVLKSPSWFKSAFSTHLA